MKDAKCRKIYVNQFDSEGNSRQLFLPCKQWTCPICGKNNKNNLRTSLKKNFQDYINSVPVKGFRSNYSLKFLTLTLPGKEFRSSKHCSGFHPEYEGTHTIEEAVKLLKKNFNKLMQALRKSYGDYRYLTVLEPQQDGYPHLHVLLAGGGVGNRKILQDIRKLWVNKYLMGTQVHLTVIKYGVRAGVNYALKYISKFTSMVYRGFRLWSIDRKLKEGGLDSSQEKIQSDWVTYEMGFVRLNGLGFEMLSPVWSLNDKKYEVSKIYDDIVPF